MFEPKCPRMILVAGPYRSGTSDDPALITPNIWTMNEAAVAVFCAGHSPVAGKWFAFPLIKTAGETISHPVTERVAARCNTRPRIGGAPNGAVVMAAIFEREGGPVFHSVPDLRAPSEAA